MTPDEAKERFLKARNLLHRMDCRMDRIRYAMQGLSEVTLTIPAEQLDWIEHEFDEGDRNTYVHGWPEKSKSCVEWMAAARLGPVPLFSEETLLVASTGRVGDLLCETYHAGDGTGGSNLRWEIASINGKSAEDFYPDDTKPSKNISFEGFSAVEATWIIDAYEKKVIEANTKLREIYTTWKSMMWQRGGLARCFGSIKDAPPVDRLYPGTKVEDNRLLSDVPMMSKFWLETVVGESKAKIVLSAIDIIRSSSEPREGEPDTPNYFGSHVTFEIPYEAIR